MQVGLLSPFLSAGVNFMNIIRTAFAHADPESVKR